MNSLTNEFINFVVFLSKKKRDCVAEEVHLCASDIILSLITRILLNILGVIYVDSVKENRSLDDGLHVTRKDIFIIDLRETRLCASCH